MSTKVNLPAGYKPYKKLTVCSNILENGLVPVSISGDQPFLVGKGKRPKVWVNMLSLKEIGVTKALVRDNLSLHDQITVDVSNREVVVKVDANVLLRVKQITDDEAEITELDLRMIGVEIYGDSNGLKIVSQTMTNNVFVGVDCMIAINMK